MSAEVTVPALGESITEVQVAAWLKQPGDQVALDEPLVEIESDKATVEVPAPVAGVLGEILKQPGEMAVVGEILARIEVGAGAEPAASTDSREEPAAPDAPDTPVMPAARRVLAGKGADPADVKGTGPGGRVLKEDALAHESAAPSAPSAPAAADAPAAAAAPAAAKKGDSSPSRPDPAPAPAAAAGGRTVREVPMSMIRRKIAERLVQSQQQGALLTTFNEIDMSRVIALRKEHQEAFTARYGVKLGFMSFFVRAAVEALQIVPELNAQIHGQIIHYHDYQDIGVAVGGGKGLVVPVLRNAERMDFGTIEQTIADFGARAAANKLDLTELEGGTFTISNGGVYGSLMSTPIINPPQSGVLGLHAIQDRPVAVDGQVVIRPMMYVAMTYDHRIVDGREAVMFLKHVKHCVEQPERLLLKV
ncbi:MAG: 2-oxoglutarate dehydrogenase complex dihydrolipoyllysine-residue succinyltransferase [Candidatus Krumholzibacteriia bacterium]